MNDTRTRATIDTCHLCEHTLRVMADELGDRSACKESDRKHFHYVQFHQLWHMLANGLRNRQAADVGKDYAERLANLYVTKGKYTKAGNYTAPYNRLLNEGVCAMVATFEENGEAS